MKHAFLSFLALAAIALPCLPACSSWSPEKKAAVKEAAISEVSSLAISAFESYRDGGKVNGGQVALDGLGGFAALLRALEMPSAPAKTQLLSAAVSGSGNNRALAKELLPIVDKLSDAIARGAPPAEAIETTARGLDRAQLHIATNLAP